MLLFRAKDPFDPPGKILIPEVPVVHARTIFVEEIGVLIFKKGSEFLIAVIEAVFRADRQIDPGILFESGKSLFFCFSIMLSMIQGCGPAKYVYMHIFKR